MPRVDIIVPVRNEGATLYNLVERISAVAFPQGVEWRILFVEDSSTDDTLSVLRQLARDNARVGFYSLERGYGQAPAILFGVSQADGDAVIMMDSDGSHPTSAFPDMIKAFLDGYDVVQCVRTGLLGRPLYRRFGAAIFQTLAKWLTGVDLVHQNTYFRLVSRRVAKTIADRPRYWLSARFPLSTGIAGRVAYLPVAASDRDVGTSKYGFLRLVRFAADTTLSLIPWQRYCILLLATATICFGLFAVDPLLAVAFIGFGAGVTIRYLTIVTKSLSRRLTVKEWAGVPLPPKARPGN